MVCNEHAQGQRAEKANSRHLAATQCVRRLTDHKMQAHPRTCSAVVSQEDRAFPISCHNSNTAKTPSMQCAAPCNKMTKHTTCSSRKCAANTHLLQAVARAARKHADVVHQPAALGRHKVADAHVGLGVAVLLSLLAQPKELGAHGAAGLVLVHLAGEGCTGEGCEQGQ